MLIFFYIGSNLDFLQIKNIYCVNSLHRNLEIKY